MRTAWPDLILTEMSVIAEGQHLHRVPQHKLDYAAKIVVLVCLHC